VAGAACFVGIGRRIYKSVALTNGVWASFTVAADLGAGFTISGLTYFQDDILIMLSSGQDIRKLNTSTNAVTVWRAGEKAQKGVAYAGQLIYAPNLANNQEELRLSGTKWNGNAVTHFRYLDAPIINMASFNGQVVIATRKSLYFMGGQPYPGEADDAAITGDSSRAPEWRGDPDPVMGHGAYAEGDDFTFLESYRGRLYTWLGGRVAEFDDSTEEANWLRIGPDGVRCYGAAVAGDWLIVAVQSRYGAYEAWGFDGSGWWLLFQRSAVGPAVVWPCALAGAGNRDELLFRDGSLTYDLLRLRWRSTALHTYASSGEWVSSLIDGDDPTADKAWTRIGATFAAPGDRGNAASVDSVSFPLEYSIDGGRTWVTVEDTPAASGANRILTRGVDYAGPPISRFLQLRQRWSSVSDWAPVLTRLWVEFENADDYALAELAQTAYEEDLAREATLRRRWEITIDAGDRNVRRDSQLDTKTGRQAISALWDAWEPGTELDFKDIDHDTDPVTYLVQIAGIEEKAARPADGARWGESTVTLILEESTAGVGTGTLHGHSLASLSDVTLLAVADGEVLTFDAVSGEWRNEPASTHAAVTVADSGSIDLTLIGQQLSAAAIFGASAGTVAEGNHVHSGGGIVLLGPPVTFPAAASAVFDGIFSAAYENYLIKLSNLAFSAAAELQLLLRAGGGDANAAGSYLGHHHAGYSTAAAPAGTLVNGALWRLLIPGGVIHTDASFEIWLTRPQIADFTNYDAHGGTRWVTGGGWQNSGGMHNVATAYDGIKLSASAGNISGIAAVYGIED
jgi:hypothetical protein